ncbi:MAG: DUF6782 family putative metallopeptidase [Myxococcota bacterium]
MAGLFAFLRKSIGDGEESSKRKKDRQKRMMTPVARACIRELLKESAPVDQRRLENIVTDVALSLHGPALLEFLLHHRVTICFDTRKGGAGYQPARQRILLNRVNVTPWVALSFVHEATHAFYHLTGAGADVANHGRDQFAANILWEEVGTRQAEVRIGRDLLHLAYESGRSDWKQYATKPVMKMWMQLVHGAPYGAPPSPEVLRQDRQLGDDLAEGLIEALRPYFLRYVEPYRAYEIRKWDIFHRNQPRMDPTVLHEALSEAMGDQNNDVLYPKRPRGGLRPVKVEAALPGGESPRSWHSGDRLERSRQRNPFIG